MQAGRNLLGLSCTYAIGRGREGDRGRQCQRWVNSTRKRESFEPLETLVMSAGKSITLRFWKILANISEFSRPLQKSQLPFCRSSGVADESLSFPCPLLRRFEQ
jgi:hypothetical protein